MLMHGFPDNLHLYDRLVPHLTPPRRVVLFDFLGWGSSDKPAGYRLPGSELFLIAGARHFVQLDEPEQVARLILTMPSLESN